MRVVSARSRSLAAGEHAPRGTGLARACADRESAQCPRAPSDGRAGEHATARQRRAGEGAIGHASTFRARDDGDAKQRSAWAATSAGRTEARRREHECGEACTGRGNEDGADETQGRRCQGRRCQGRRSQGRRDEAESRRASSASASGSSAPRPKAGARTDRLQQAHPGGVDGTSQELRLPFVLQRRAERSQVLWSLWRCRPAGDLERANALLRGHAEPREGEAHSHPRRRHGWPLVPLEGGAARRRSQRPTRLPGRCVRLTPSRELLLPRRQARGSRRRLFERRLRARSRHGRRHAQATRSSSASSSFVSRRRRNPPTGKAPITRSSIRPRNTRAPSASRKSSKAARLA